ncbi:MAG TPA: efflux RND transporter permease subunit [Acidiferrobacter sp.]|nr:efflux RND transporter permease subunit [Acidiferrobacter sp.]
MAARDPLPEEPLNISGRLTHYFIESKITILVIIVAVLGGALALRLTPRTENPQIVVPAANIIIYKPGASPREVKNLIVDPLEAILRGMHGVHHTYGLALDSMGVVTVKFEVGQNRVASLVRLYNKIMSNMDRMPPGTEQPIIQPLDVNQVPIVTISLATEHLNGVELRAIGVRVLHHLRRAPGTSIAYVIGGQRRKINVVLHPTLMRRYNVTLVDIRRIVQATNVNIPSGHFTNHNRRTTIHAGGMLRSAEDVGSIVVSLYDHKPVFLHDVATVTDGPGRIKAVHSIGFGPAYAQARPRNIEIPEVTIAIAKRSGTNAVTVADGIIQKLDALKGTVIPNFVHVTITRNDGQRANSAVNTLIEHLFIAVSTVILLLVLFLGWRAAAIVTITIPLILFVTLAVGYMAGQTINRITLFALILSLGLLVDDSIVVIENIFRHYAKPGIDRAREAILAVNEIGAPTNLATLAVIVAFLPMLSVTGMMGPYMAPIPKNVPVAMIASLFIAYTVAPWAAKLWLKGHFVHEDAKAGLLQRGYERIMRTLLSRPIARRGFLVAIILLFVGVLLMPMLRLVNFKMLPRNNNNSFDITVRTRAGSTLEDTNRVVKAIGDIVRQNPYVTTYELSSGGMGAINFSGLLRGETLKKGPTVGEVQVHLLRKHERAVSSIDIVRNMRPAITALAARTGAMIKIVQHPPGPPVRATVMAEVFGPDYHKQEEIAQDLRYGLFAHTRNLVGIDSSVPHDSVQYTIEVNRRRAAEYGVNPAQVAETLKGFLAGINDGTVHIAHAKEPVPIHFRIPIADRIGPYDLGKIFFTNPDGKEIPLSAISRVIKRTAARPIYQKDGREVVYVTAGLSPGSPVYAVLHMWEYLKDHSVAGVHLKQSFMKDPGSLSYGVRWSGEMRLTLNVFRDLGSAFGVAIALIYIILVGYYRSFMIPLIVMGAIPLTIIGVLPGHAIMHQFFTATSMIGVIALAGIVVRNSLLLIDFILDYRRAGHSLTEAVVQAGMVRLRPIMLTALAIMLGTAVMIVDPVFGGLAISLIFGTLASTVLTLFVIPLGYFGYARFSERRGAASNAG